MLLAKQKHQPQEDPSRGEEDQDWGPDGVSVRLHLTSILAGNLPRDRQKVQEGDVSRG
jgi:hypothetical protein